MYPGSGLGYEVEIVALSLQAALLHWLVVALWCLIMYNAGTAVLYGLKERANCLGSKVKLTIH